MATRCKFLRSNTRPSRRHEPPILTARRQRLTVWLPI